MLESLAVPRMPLAQPPLRDSRVGSPPELVAEVSFRTEDRLLRHVSYQGSAKTSEQGRSCGRCRSALTCKNEGSKRPVGNLRFAGTIALKVGVQIGRSPLAAVFAGSSQMNLAIVQRISAASESACVAVLQEPKDKAARKRLFLALADLIDPAFQGEEADDYYSGQLIREVRLWADIVRTRIQLARESTTMKPTLRITYSVQQLLLMLSDLAGECSRADIALTLLDPQVSWPAYGSVGSGAAVPVQA